MAGRSGKIKVKLPREEAVWELAPLETSPCTLACPTRINARGYVSLIADGRFPEALALIRQRNPFPGVCGRVCPRPCEAACRRGTHDEAVAICALKRFVFDAEMKRGVNPAVPARIHRRAKVAVVGAGPAGLAAASKLASLGYPVTVFEAKDEPGGMMNLIPEFRLPRAVVRRESRAILDQGIELVTGTRFGHDITWDWLKQRAFKALLLCTGAWKPVWKWGASGTAGVVHGLDFLAHAALEVEGKDVAVAGDGMMALDCARTAVRLGARRVTLVVGTSRTLAPVHGDDLALAEREGVRTLFLARPSRLVTKGKKLSAVAFVKLRESAGDATGRREAREISGSEFTGDFDTFIDAYTRGIDSKGLGSRVALAKSSAGTVAVDPGTHETGVPGVFAAGDLVAGPRSIVEAIASGQKAAYGIHRYLGGDAIPSPFDLTIDEDVARREFSLERVPERRSPRETMPLEEARSRRDDFREVERGYTAQGARREAERCLRCGPCSECVLCIDVCEKKTILLRAGDETIVDVHAGRDFWSRMGDSLEIELDGETAEVAPVRTVCFVDERRCVGCGRCSHVCAYRAAQVEARPGGGFVSRVDELACKGCGSCVGVCPTGAMVQRSFEAGVIAAALSSIEPARTKVVFACHWARPAKIELPQNVVLIETMCTGRIPGSLMADAVLRGASAVMVCGCGEEDCHYGFGRRQSVGAVRQCRELLALLGCDPGMITEERCGRNDFSGVVKKWARRSK